VTDNPNLVIDFELADRRGLQIAVLVCPGYAPIDIIGIHTIFGILPGVQVHLVWKDLEEIVGIPTFPTRATTTFADCPAELDVLFAGAVMPDTFEDEETLEFLADRGARARWVGGACAGSLLMGAAGLLRGYRATTNFQLHDLLPKFGAIPARGNVVEDRNRITAGPVTGGIEIGLRLVQDFFGDEVAREMEVQTEYAPAPLYGVGTPELAGPELTRRALDHGAAIGEPLIGVADRAARRPGVTAAAVG
jgi:transcriptional regulator GlxA family with amidase domain